MPHLDEGALWVRATTPYTISFEEASKLSPQIRDILLELPAGDDRGQRTWAVPTTAPTPPAITTTNSTSGCNPYNDKTWSGEFNTKPKLIEALQKKLHAFPGVIFNYTQPAEDAVDEAETGLKSALAVKIFGADLATLEEKAVQVREFSAPHARHHRDHDRARAGAAEPRHYAGSRQAGALRLERKRRKYTGGDRAGGTAATQVIQGERQFDLVVRMPEQYRSNADENASGSS